MKIAVIIPAAGTGTRMNNELPKQFFNIDDVPILIKTIKIFDDINEVESIVIPVHTDWISYTKELINKYDCNKVKEITIGGKERQDSVNAALHTVHIKEADIVLIHDAVRPFTTKELIYKLIETADDCGAAIPIIKVSDSVKQIDNKGKVLKTLNREHIGLVQTPQAYWTSIIIEVYEKAAKTGFYGTDSSSLVEYVGYKVQYVDGEASNIKITTPVDLELANILSTK